MFCDVKSEVLLFQTDTTVGLASQDALQLADIKSRPPHKQFLKIYSHFINLQSRVPSKFKNRVRRSSKTTFVINNSAFRVTSPNVSSTFLDTYNWYYSTSANSSGSTFDRVFCESVADIIIEDKKRLFETTASQLIKLNNNKMKLLR